MYILKVSKEYEKRLKKILKKNKGLIKDINRFLRLLIDSPFYKSLSTHKVVARNFGECWSSSITSDLRCLWKFEGGNIILLLTLGGHSGNKKVYK